ncbi:FUSC family protein [Bacillus marasmi]|uniref:FUSC family protein n=1 Tax=Bacillus marasmi TaxID=1926279 RepID=UPI0011C9CF89|nr:aromatic acid exporter family protein [Bacillus marasmi]
MKLGARIFKTGIAIILALLLSELLKLPSPVFAGIAAIFAIQPTIYRSYLSIIEQIQGNLIGAIIAVSFVLLFGNDVIIIGLAAIIVITINLKLNIENTIGLSLVTLIAIMETPGDEFIQFGLIRFSTIMLGVLSAFIVNLVFIPPKYENKLFDKITEVTEEIIRWIRYSIRHASEHRLLKHDISKIKDSIIKVDQLFLMYMEERNYFKKITLVKSRKLVIYRQMVATTKRALEVLKRLHRYENELQQMPTEFQKAVQAQLDCLINHHEQMLLLFIGKIKPNAALDNHEHCMSKQELFDLFLAQQKDFDDPQSPILFHSMQVISSIIEYREQIEHLETLITSFQAFHKNDH